MATEAKPLDLPAAVPTTQPEIAHTETPVPTIVEPVTTEPTIASNKAEEPIKAHESTITPTAATAAPVATGKIEEKAVTPITEGLLHYKAPAKFPMNLVPGRDHQYFFWFGDAAVPVEKLSSFTHSKSDFAHEATAWSSQTGKGLLYYAKDAEHKDSPAGVIPLSNVTNIKANGAEFSFKIAEHKHTFMASSFAERAGWVEAFKSEVEHAVSKKEEVHGSEGYKSTLAGFAPAVVGTSSSAPKKSVDLERATREEKKTLNTKEKSRSVSRGKGIFDRFSKKDAVASETTPAAETTAVPATEAVAAPVIASTETPVHAHTEAAPITEPAVAPVVATETKPEDVIAADEAKTEKPTIATRRSSRIGNFFLSKKVATATTDKKDGEVAPLAATETAKDGEVSTGVTAEDIAARVLAAPVSTAVATDAVAAPAVEVPVASAATTEGVTPGREKKKFSLPNLFEKKARSPTTEVAPVAESSEAPIVSEPAVATTGAEAVKPIEAPATTSATALESEKAAAPLSPVDKNEKRRSSFFSGDLAGSIKKLTGNTKEKKVADAEAVKQSEDLTAHPVAHESTEYTQTATPRTDAALDISNTEAVKAAEKEEAKDEVADVKKTKSSNNIMRRISIAIRGRSQERKVSPTHAAKTEESTITKPTTISEPVSSEAPKIEEPTTFTEQPLKPVTDSTTPAAFNDMKTETSPLATGHTAPITA